MLIAAAIIYIIGFFVAGGPFWPLELIFGKAGPIGVILGLGWLLLLIIGGINN